MVQQSSLRVDAPVFVPKGMSLSLSSTSSPASTPSTSPPSAFSISVASSSQHLTGRRNPKSLSTLSSPSSSVCSDTEEEAPSFELTEDSDCVEDGHQLAQNYLYHRYVSLLEKALAERAACGPGNSILVRSLYPFWVARLTHKFNRNMYRTFVRLAVEDCAVGDHVGLLKVFTSFVIGVSGMVQFRRVLSTPLILILDSLVPLRHGCPLPLLLRQP